MMRPSQTARRQPAIDDETEGPTSERRGLLGGEDAPVALSRGVVVGVDEPDARFLVRVGTRRCRAWLATSCLVVPEVGDQILLAMLPEDEGYVLAVLGRAEHGAAVKVAVKGELDIRAERLRLEGAESVDLCSPEDVRLRARRFSLTALAGHVGLEQLTLAARLVQSQLDRATVVASAIDRTVERVVERVKRSYRTIEEFEELRAERLDYRAQETMSLRGKHTVITARELIKVDGTQIHVG